MNQFIFSLVFTFIFAISFATGQTVVAQSESTPTSYRAYEIEWYPSDHPREFEAIGVSANINTAKNTGEEDAVEFYFTDLLQTTLLFEYYHATADLSTTPNGNATNITAAAFVFISRYFYAFEYIDEDGVQGYNNNTDIISGYYDLSNVWLGWKDIAVTSGNISVDGTEYDYFTVTAQTSDDVFLVRFTGAGYPSSVEGVKINPETVKVDIEVRWFDNPNFTGPTLYSTGPSSVTDVPNAQVAVLFAFAAEEAETNVDVTGSSNNAANVTFTAGEISGFFSWETSANVTVEGVASVGVVTGTVQDTASNTNVTSSFEIGWEVAIVVYAFEGNRPSLVVWDPEMGGNIPYSGVDFLHPSITLFILSMLFLFKF